MQVKTRKEFARIYGMLNKEQKEAVDTIDGPVMVIAGPGTGKTQILTLRIANILLKTDIPADAILALTFTNAAAANMRKRLVSIIGSDAYRVSIFTFHSFANHLIERYPERFSSVTGRSNVSEVERIDILRLLLDQGRFEIIKPLGEPHHNVSEILIGISKLKREGLSPQDFNAWVTQERSNLLARTDLMHAKGAHKGKMKGEFQKMLRSFDKNEELGLLYERYEEELARRKRYDFDDSLLLLIKAMDTNEAFLQELQEEYQYFLVDEHQDTNGAQNRILELLVTYFDSPNLFVVGDEKQAIFRFQGASLANFLYFEKKFKNVRRITLTTNYRSHQGVLNAAHSIIVRNEGGITAPLVSHTSRTPQDDLRIKVYSFSADDEELLFLAESIKRLLSDGVTAHEIAVLIRNNRDAESVADYFERLSIPFLIESGHGVIDDPDIRKLCMILRSLADLSNDDALAKLLFVSYLGVSVPDAYSLLHEARVSKRPLFDVIHRPNHAELEHPEQIRNFAGKLASWKQASENEPFLNMFERVVRESGILTHLQKSTFHLEKFDKLVRLFDEMKAHVYRHPFFTLSDFTTFLTILEEHNLVLEAKSRQIPNAVRLMTAHKAKGLEFDYVFIVQAHDGHWGGKRTSQYFSLPVQSGSGLIVGSDEEDERRLFYVAITRARKDVFISFVERSPDGRERVPSQFIEEIREEYKSTLSGERLGYTAKRPPLFVERKGRRGQERYVEFVREEFAQRGLSATALNNYLTCPWKWFYENFFYTQFVPSVHQIKGTAVHHALEDFFNSRNTNSQVGVELLLERFSHHLEKADITTHTFERVHKETGEALRGWYAERHTQWTKNSENELFVKGVLLDTDILLTGKLDKLECLDTTCRDVRVVDYKTGRPKSRNDIEGTTQGALRTPGSGGYKRQLVFYNVLLSMWREGHYSMREGVIDFIEPTERGVYKQESFVITRDEVDELKSEIRRVAGEIRDLSFWNTRCVDEDCSACALRDLME